MAVTPISGRRSIQVTRLVISEVTQCHHYNRRHVVMRFHCRVWYHALSLRYARIQSLGIILIP